MVFSNEGFRSNEATGSLYESSSSNRCTNPETSNSTGGCNPGETTPLTELVTEILGKERTAFEKQSKPLVKVTKDQNFECKTKKMLLNQLSAAQQDTAQRRIHFFTHQLPLIKAWLESMGITDVQPGNSENTVLYKRKQGHFTKELESPLGEFLNVLKTELNLYFISMAPAHYRFTSFSKDNWTPSEKTTFYEKFGLDFNTETFTLDLLFFEPVLNDFKTIHYSPCFQKADKTQIVTLCEEIKKEVYEEILNTTGCLPDRNLNNVMPLFSSACEQGNQEKANICLKYFSGIYSLENITLCNFRKLIVHVNTFNSLRLPDFIEKMKDHFPVEVEVTPSSSCTALPNFPDSITALTIDGTLCSDFEKVIQISKRLNHLESFTVKNIPINSLNLSGHKQLKEVSFSNLPQLKTLILEGLKLEQLHMHALPRLTELKLSGCLMSAPCLDQFTAQLSNCSALTTLDLSNCQLTDDVFATLAPILKNLNQLKTLAVSGNAITYIPPSLNGTRLLQEVSKGMKNFKNYPIPQLPGNKQAYLEIKKDIVKSNPLDVFYTIGPHLFNASKLKIKYEGEGGRDAGGLCRDFIAVLFKAFKNLCITEDGYPTWDKNFRVVGADAMLQTSYTNLGIVLAFILGTRGQFPIGPIFSHEVFDGLKNCTDSMVGKAYSELSVEELAALCSPSYRETLEMDSLLSFFSATTSRSARPHLNALRNIYYGCGEDVPEEYEDYFSNSETRLNPEEFATLKQNAREMLLAFCENKIRPILEIAKGIKKVPVIWQSLPKLTARFIEITIQGTLAKGSILQSLEYNETIPKSHRGWLESWITKANHLQLESFLVFVTGANALTVGNPIKVEQSNKEGLFGHTCWRQLDIHLGFTEETLWRELNALSGEEQAFNAN